MDNLAIHFIEDLCASSVLLSFGIVLFILCISYILNKNYRQREEPENTDETSDQSHGDIVLLRNGLEERFLAQPDNPLLSYILRKHSNIADMYGCSSSHHDVEWKKPVYLTGPNDKNIAELFNRSGFNIDIGTWKERCNVTDAIVNDIACKMKRIALTVFPGLIIREPFSKQGSSRNGLQVSDPLEFDYILPFDIDGVKFKEDAIYDQWGKIVPGHYKVKPINHEKIPTWINKHKLLESKKGITYINTRNFQNSVFTSLLDQCLKEIILEEEGSSHPRFQTITRSVAPPTLKIKIELNSKTRRQRFERTSDANVQFSNGNTTCIEVDLVPGSIIYCNKKNIDCTGFGLLKWVNKKNQAISLEDQNLVWRKSTCEYEKEILDKVDGNESQQFVMTACRALKGVLREFKSDSQNQLASVLTSYHLKTICFYCMALLTQSTERKKLSGAEEALGYFVKYLALSIDAGYLPHFFFGNKYLEKLLPNNSFKKGKKRLNLLKSVDPETMRQAKLSLRRFLQELEGCYFKEHLLDSSKIEEFEKLLSGD